MELKIRATRIYKSPVFGIAAILLLMCLGLTFSTNKFLTQTNIISVIRQFSFISIMAIGECIVIITGGIDLSVGSVFAFSSVLSAMSLSAGMPVGVALVIGVLSGLTIGYINGIFITKVGLPPFIATLGMMSVTRGLAYAVTAGFPINIKSPSFSYIGQGYIGIVPVPVVLLIVIAIVATVFLNKIVLGRQIYALGGNEEGSRVSGINVMHVKRVVFSISGGLAAVAGIATAARLGVAQSTAGMGYELDAIAAVIIGGASVKGGSGTVAGTILGAAIMGVLRNALVLLSVSAYWQQAIIGCVILLAVSLDQLRNRKS
jgi:ribose transport system permease protein